MELTNTPSSAHRNLDETDTMRPDHSRTTVTHKAGHLSNLFEGNEYLGVLFCFYSFISLHCLFKTIGVAEECMEVGSTYWPTITPASRITCSTAATCLFPPNVTPDDPQEAWQMASRSPHSTPVVTRRGSLTQQSDAVMFLCCYS
jgi:hypothetical protein